MASDELAAAEEADEQWARHVAAGGWPSIHNTKLYMPAYVAKFEALERDLARALPVVEAAGAVVDGFCWSAQEGSIADEENEELHNALVRAVRGAREPRTGERT